MLMEKSTIALMQIIQNANRAAIEALLVLSEFNLSGDSDNFVGIYTVSNVPPNIIVNGLNIPLLPSGSFQQILIPFGGEFVLEILATGDKTKPVQSYIYDNKDALPRRLKINIFLHLPSKLRSLGF